MRRVRTDPVEPDAGVLAAVADALAAGRVAIVPTETVYGLAAAADQPAAVAALNVLKGRSEQTPLQVLVASVEQARALAAEWPADAERLAVAFWPGALTMVLPAAAAVPDEVRAADGTVGLRCPDHGALGQVLALTGPLAATSANRTGEPAPTTADEALAQLGERVEIALDCGAAVGGVASSVVRVSGDGVTVLREAALTAGDLTAAGVTLRGGGA